MDSDEDICVLQYSDNDDDNKDDKDITVDAAGPNLFFPFTPISPHAPAAGNEQDFGSHEALKIAFLTLKQKLSDTKAHNQQLVEKVRELESSKSHLSGGGDLESFAVIAESFDMMEDARYAAEGGTSSQPTGNMLVGPGEGFPTSNNLHRQMAPVPSKTEGGDSRTLLHKERSPSTPDKSQSCSSLNQQVAELRQENGRLQQGWEAERREKDAALQSLRSLQERCCTLQVSLNKANQEVSLLKEKRGGVGGDSLSEVAPPELLSEMAQMRRVIDKLKTMVLMQKDCLVNQSMCASMRSSMTSTPCGLPPEPHLGPHQGHSEGHSWEMVNGASSLSSSDPNHQHHRQLQQRSAKMASGDLNPRRDPSMTPPSSVSSGKSMGTQNGPTPPLPPKNQTGPLTGPQNVQNVAGPRQNPRGESIIRRHSEVNVAAPPGGKVEVTRAHTLPQPQSPGALSAWMSTHYERKEQGRVGEVVLQPGAVGLNQFLKDTTPGPTPAPGKMETGQIVTSRPSQQPMGAQYPPSNAYYTQRQSSPLNQPDSTYDNVAYTSTATTANTQGTIVPSMHILNQSSMTGARVLQSSGVTSPPREIHVGRDGPGTRTSPQEHTDLTQRPPNPTDLELSPAIRFVNEPTNPETAANSDRKCPVCGQDFSHITMDEFQTHVFECFDDDDFSNNPETMQPQGQRGQRSGVNDRVCPMCQESFAQTISQDFFESHVQSHFEDVVDHFELLEVNRT